MIHPAGSIVQNRQNIRTASNKNELKMLITVVHSSAVEHAHHGLALWVDRMIKGGNTLVPQHASLVDVHIAFFQLNRVMKRIKRQKMRNKWRDRVSQIWTRIDRNCFPRKD